MKKAFLTLLLFVQFAYSQNYVYIFPDNKYGANWYETSNRAKRGDIVDFIRFPDHPTEYEKSRFIIYETDQEVRREWFESDSNFYRTHSVDIGFFSAPGIYKKKIEKVNKKGNFELAIHKFQTVLYAGYAVNYRIANALIPRAWSAVTVDYDSINKATGGQYATIDLWEADTDNDLVSGELVQVGICHTGGDTCDGGWTIAGATVSSTCYRRLTALEADRHDGTDTGCKIGSSSDADNTVSEDYFKIDWLNIDGNNTGDILLKIQNANHITMHHLVLHESNEWGIQIDRTTRNWTDEHWLYSSFFWSDAWGVLYNRSGRIHIRHISAFNCGDNSSGSGTICSNNYGQIGIANSIIHNANAYTGTGNCFRAIEDSMSWLDDTGWNAGNDDTPQGGWPLDSQIAGDIFTDTTTAGMDLHLKNTASVINRGQYLELFYPTGEDIGTINDIDGENFPTESGLESDIFEADMGADENTGVSDETAYDAKYVRVSGDTDAWSTKDPGDIYNSIQDALNAVDDYGYVYVAAGRYYENIAMPTKRKLYGGFLGTETSHNQRGANYNFMWRTTIDAAGTYDRCIYANSDNIIDGFRLVYGNPVDACTGGSSGAGILGQRQTMNYLYVRNVVAESCRCDTGSVGALSTAAQGGGIVVDSQDGAGVLTVKNFIAIACTAYCGAIEVRHGCQAAAHFYNCLSIDNLAFGFEISVEDPVTVPENQNHRIYNCIGLSNKSPRSDIPGLGQVDSLYGTNWNTNYWSWAKDSAYSQNNYSTGVPWGDGNDDPDTGFWSDPKNFIFADSTEFGSVCFWDSSGQNYQLKGNSPCRTTGIGGDFPLYMGPYAPLIARIFTSQ